MPLWINAETLVTGSPISPGPVTAPHVAGPLVCVYALKAEDGVTSTNKTIEIVTNDIIFIV